MQNENPARTNTVHGTQSFVGTIAECWRRPSLLAIELAWRWGVGIPLLALLLWQAMRILGSVSLAHTGIEHFSLIDTVAAAETVRAAADLLLPPTERVAIWLLPLIAGAWSLAAGFGRSWLLRRYDPGLGFHPSRMIALQLIRLAMLAASIALWFAGLHGSAVFWLNGPVPNLVGYFVQTIFLSFAVFCLWAAAGWVFSIAPLLAVLENLSVTASLRASFGGRSLGGLRPKLVEINFILGILKLALIVLAMVFCATPVPFKEEISGVSLYAWWTLVTIAYFAASDFFQVARVIGFIELWRTVHRRASVGNTNFR